MAFKRITENDMLGKGNVGKPDTPGVSTSEMQRIMDELPREVIAPAFNELSGQLEADTASADIGANAPDGITPDPAPAENSPAKLQSVLQGIVNKITDHIADHVKHVASEERTSWNNASNDRHTHDNKSILDGITSSLVGNWNAAFAHVSDAVRHITENERTNWNDKYTKSETDKAINERVVEIGSSDMTKAVYDPETRNLPYIPKIDAEALTLGKNVVLSGTPVSIAYAGAQRIASITAYGENAQGGTTEAPVALTGISSVTVNDDVTELPIPRPLHRVGDVRDVCVTRQEYEGTEKLVVTYNVGFVELDGTEAWRYGAGQQKELIISNFVSAPTKKEQICSHAAFEFNLKGAGFYIVENLLVFGANYTGKQLSLDEFKNYLAAQKEAGTPVQVAYQLATPEVYATEPLDFDNAAGPLTVMTGGELEVRMTELIGTRSPELTAKMDRATYDADGDGVVDEAAAAPWDGITGKPGTFTPSTHNHDDRYYTESEMDTKLNGKANSSHTHGVSDISGVLPSSKGGTGANKSVLSISSAVVTTESQGYANVDISTSATICAVVSQGSATGQCYSISVIDPKTGGFSIQVKDYNGNVVANKTLRVNYIAYSI